jgi:hypothetical protein
MQVETSPHAAGWRYRFVFASVATLWLAHFALVALSLMPPNPLRHQFQFEIQRYLTPWFTQNWNLFAPNPVNGNFSLLVQYRYETASELHTSQWIDVTTPILDLKHRSFWSPAPRIAKFLMGAMQNVNEDSRSIAEHIAETEDLKTDPEAASEFLREAITRSRGHAAFVQYSSFVFRAMESGGDLPPPSSEIEVRYLIQEALFPRFSRRHLDYFDLENYEFRQHVSHYYWLVGDGAAQGAGREESTSATTLR